MNDRCNLPRHLSKLSLLLISFTRSSSHYKQQTLGRDSNNDSNHHHGGVEPAWGVEVVVKYFIEVNEWGRGSEFIRITLRPLHPLDSGSLDYQVGPGEGIACSVAIVMYCLAGDSMGLNGQRWRSLVVDCGGTLQRARALLGVYCDHFVKLSQMNNGRGRVELRVVRGGGAWCSATVSGGRMPCAGSGVIWVGVDYSAVLELVVGRELAEGFVSF